MFSTTYTHGDSAYSRDKSAFAVTDTGVYFQFGGFDSAGTIDTCVHLLDLSTGKWETRESTQQREGHTAIFIGNNRMLIFGGLGDTEGIPEADLDNQLIIYDITDDSWYAPDQSLLNKEHAPKTFIANHAACLDPVNGLVYISGGLDVMECSEETKYTPLVDMYVYSLSYGQWVAHFPFVGRFSHSIACYDGRIWAFGGLDGNMARQSRKVSSIDQSGGLVSSVQFDLEDIRVDLTGSEKIMQSPSQPHHFIFADSEHARIEVFSARGCYWTEGYSFEVPFSWVQSFELSNNLYLMGAGERHPNPSIEADLGYYVCVPLVDTVPAISYMESSSVPAQRLAQDFESFFNHQQFVDFDITAVETGHRLPETCSFLEKPLMVTDTELEDGHYYKSDPIKCHKAILLARWPHFRTLLSANMSEAVTATMFIPEPKLWVSIFIRYLYTEKLEDHPPLVMAGILSMSHIYSLPELRQKCIQNLMTRNIGVEDLLEVWQVADMLNEESLRDRVLNNIFNSWGRIVKLGVLEHCDKEVILQLFSLLNAESRILVNPHVAKSKFNRLPLRSGSPISRKHSMSSFDEVPRTDDSDCRM
ncbi:unnamed protein product [Kuraishia capsulata CBS 1993]|uniref:BTB domain-containing protein n=1 Tax=Kuraishia capsulata CBS 1993 TaxID=1382522 RepID=W6MI10_9ASCO|nr:uncharacterized protein KUCA_T00001696001 [Kuraishia capsulata CBS 1993]CDK25726.1 unnamed protein product [Kuraishia capsulata CBS 1993]